MKAWLVVLLAIGAQDPKPEPKTPQAAEDAARRHVEEITVPRFEYGVAQGGTLDGTNGRSPLGGGFGIWTQSWESNRAVRLENAGDTDLIDPWLSNGRNDFRTMSI